MNIYSLTDDHHKQDFDCGENSLNEYLKKYALQHARRGIGKTFIAVDEGSRQQILGFYTLCVGSISWENLPNNKKFPKYPIPVVRLARLAVDMSCQGRNIGETLLMDCLQRSLKISDEIACIGIVVDAKNDNVKNFYSKYSFVELKNTPLILILTFEVIRKTILLP